MWLCSVLQWLDSLGLPGTLAALLTYRYLHLLILIFTTVLPNPEGELFIITIFTAFGSFRLMFVSTSFHLPPTFGFSGT